MTEQALINICYFLAFQLFNCTFIHIFYSLALTPRIKPLIIVSVMGTIQCIIYNLTYFTTPTIIRFLMQITIIYLPAILLFRDSLKKKLLCASLLFAVMMISDLLISILTNSLFGFIAVQMKVKTWDCVFQALAMNAIAAAIYAAVLYLWRSKMSGYPPRTMSLFIIFPMSQAISICGYYYISPDAIEITNTSENPFAVISLILYVVSDIFMLMALRDNARTEHLRLQLKDMEHETEMQTLYYENITRQFSEIKEYRHDIKNLVAAAEITMLSGSWDEGLSMLDELKIRAENLELPIFCSNAIVNSVLWEKKRECSLCGIKFSLAIAHDENIPLEKSDACSLFANLLDNAISEAKSTTEPYVSVSCRSEIGILFLEVRNSTEKNFKAAPYSTKVGKNHGNGLAIVQSIAKKYSGDFLITADGREAKAIFTVPLNSLQKQYEDCT